MRTTVDSFSTASKACIILILVLFFSACTTSNAKFSITELGTTQNKKKMLIIPVEVELYEISVGGIPELKADWTEKGKKNLNRSLTNFIQDSTSASPVFYKLEEEEEETHSQFFRLLSVVGGSIFTHYHNRFLHLPAKKEFDWSLGETTQILKSQYDADYALYVQMSDFYSSSGRIAMGVLTALLGYAPRTGFETGFAYLVDLNSGEIVWFNFLQGSSFGDIRETDGANQAVTALLDQFPK